MYFEDVAWILRYCGSGVGWQLQLGFDPKPGNFHMLRVWPLKKKKKKNFFFFFFFFFFSVWFFFFFFFFFFGLFRAEPVAYGSSQAKGLN